MRRQGVQRSPTMHSGVYEDGMSQIDVPNEDLTEIIYDNM